MLVINKVTKRYANKRAKKNEITALNEVSIDLPDKGFIFINGESGSGKTTLMNILAGLDSITTGDIFCDGIRISVLSEYEWDRYRNLNLGIIFQSFNLIEDMSVKENILLPLKIQSGKNRELYEDSLVDVLNYVGLTGYENRKPSELSAGQLQRVAIARAVIKHPRIILADEATGNLDPFNTKNILDLFNDISKKCLVIFISHDKKAAESYADRIITLENGRIVADRDNRRLKELSINKYHVVIKKRNFTKKIPIDDFNIKKEIENLEHMELDSKELVHFEVGIEKGEIAEKSEEYAFEPSFKNFCHDRPLPLSDLLTNSMRNICGKKIRTFLTIGIITFICSIFVLMNIFIRNDYINSITKYFTSTGERYISVSRNIFYADSLYDMAVSLDKGIVFYDSLVNVVGKENVIRYCDYVQMSYGKEYSEIRPINVCIYESEVTFKGINLEGDFPKGENQIAINKDISEALSIQIGDTVAVCGVECNVTGIVAFEIAEHTKCYSIISSDVINNIILNSDTLSVQGTDITKSVDKTDFAYSVTDISSNSSLIGWGQDAIVFGRYPEKENEVMLSSSLAEQLGDWVIGKDVNYRIPDLYDKKYNGLYDDIINLYNYTGRNISVVGIYDSEYTQYQLGDIVFVESVYKKILDEYTKELNYDGCLVYFDKNSYGAINELTYNGYILNDTACSYCICLEMQLIN